jgi:putative ABC transport system permease protein
MIQDYLKIVLMNLWQRKLRSSLTVLAIVIGVASIVALITISQSLQSSIEGQFNVLGANKLIIMPSSSSGAPNLYSGLNTKDVDALERVSELTDIVPFLLKSDVMTFQKEDKRMPYMLGVPSNDAELLVKDYGIELDRGRFFSADGDQIVIGPLVAEELFKNQLSINSRVEIAGRKFTVVGILKSIGNPQDDSNVYMPLSTMRELYNDKTSVSEIEATVKAGIDVNEAAAKAKAALKKVRDEKEFEVFTSAQLLSQLGSILAIVQGVLVSIAAISLLVGGVGIANVMYTTVMQRTREIGIMKAVGAKNSTILALFIMEAGLIGFAGGIVGIALGILIAKLVEIVAANSGWTVFKVSISPGVIIFGLAFSVIVGMISGALPARQAAGLKPVDALRFGK